MYISESEMIVKILSRLKSSAQISDLAVDENKISFSFKSLFSIPYIIDIIVKKKNEIFIEIKLSKLIQVCIALALFTAFFSKFGVRAYLWFTAILILLFFSINILIIRNLLKQLVIEPFNTDVENANQEIITSQQKKWINDATKCPACGDDITEYDLHCPDCGLRLRNNAVLSPFNVTKYKDSRFKYFFRVKNENTNKP